MPIRAALLCSDEKALDAVTQVFAELDLSFEHFHDPALAIKRLGFQRFDAVLVDCDNVENATLVLDNLRKSCLNQNSISIAIVDGKAGVPTAFRLGASLVMTKPVSLEQVKSTLRNAMSMHRKDSPEAKAFGSVATPGFAPAPHTGQRAGDNPAKIVLRAPTQSAAEATPLSNVQPADVSPTVRTVEIPSIPVTGTLQSPRSTGPTRTEAVSQTSAHKMATSDAQTSHLGDPDTTQKPTSVRRKFTTAPAFSAKENSPKKTNWGFATACAFLVAGAGFYAAFTMQPAFHSAVLKQYDTLHSIITGTAAHPQTAVVPTAAPTAANPVEAQSPSTSSSALPTKVEATPSSASNVTLEGFSPQADNSVNNASESPGANTPASGAVLLATSGSAKKVASNLVNVNDHEPVTVTVTVPADVADRHVSYRMDATYPESARRKGLQGTVFLQASVNQDGTVGAVKVIRGNTQLAAAAVEAVQQWRYEPYYHSGQPAAFETQITVRIPRADKKPR